MMGNHKVTVVTNSFLHHHFGKIKAKQGFLKFYPVITHQQSAVIIILLTGQG
jgi:hypothetical protein